MDASNEVILLSFGSTVEAFPQDVLARFHEAFSQIAQTVVMRQSLSPVIEVPPNVYVTPKWLPQNDILGHAKTVLFINHCGNNGQYESLYHGVPLIGIPMFGDQFHNCHRAEAHGYGLDMRGIHEFSADDLVKAIHEVIQNP
ncbi:hypothetical protein CAPTEDRAFT_145299, partial [Capitella teleta]